MRELTRFSRFLLVGVILLHCGCSREEQPPAASHTPATQATPGTTSLAESPQASSASNVLETPKTIHEGTTRSGRYKVQWTASPTVVPLNQLFAMDVDVTMPDGKTPYVGTVKVDIWMPAHRHGREDVEPMLTPVAAKPGRYHVKGLKLHMPGQWEVRVDVGEESSWDVAYLPVYVE